MKHLLLHCAILVLLSGSVVAQTPAATGPGVSKNTANTKARPKTKKKIVAADTLKPKEIKLPKLVDLGADKCIPCKMMVPVLDELTKEYQGKLEVVFIDVWKNSGEGEKYKVRVIPTQIFFGNDGKELFRHEGFFAKQDILAKWKELGYDLKQ